MTLTDFVFRDNTCNENGLICVSATAISYENCHFNNNEGLVRGIVNLVAEGAICNFSNCVFDTCTAQSGGIIYTTVSVAEIGLSSCEFANCRTTSNDGAILTSTGCANVTIEGGSIVACPGVAISVEEDTVNVYVADVTFEKCGTGSKYGVIYAKKGTDGLSMTFEHCTVTECGSDSGLLYMVREKIDVLAISDNTFANEDAYLNAAILTNWDTSYIELLVIDRNNYNSKSTNSPALVLKKPGNLQFTENNFTLSVKQQSGISLTFPVDQRQYRIERCIFDNQKESIWGAPFLDLGLTNTDLFFIECHFQNIASTVAGAGVYIPDGNEWSVTISGCQFVNLKTQGNGGAVYSGSVRSLEVDDCTFDLCSIENPLSDKIKRRGGGALYISAKTRKSIVSNCVFSNNVSPNNGTSLQVMGSGGRPVVTLTNCTFKDHTEGPVLCFGICSADECTDLKESTETLPISTCYFINNKLRTEFGLIKCTEYASSSFENCIFSNNENKEDKKYYGLICLSVYEGSSCRFSDCVFNQSVTQDEVMKGVINLMNGLPLETLELSLLANLPELTQILACWRHPARS